MPHRRECGQRWRRLSGSALPSGTLLVRIVLKERTRRCRTRSTRRFLIAPRAQHAVADGTSRDATTNATTVTAITAIVYTDATTTNVIGRTTVWPTSGSHERAATTISVGRHHIGAGRNVTIRSIQFSLSGHLSSPQHFVSAQPNANVHFTAAGFPISAAGSFECTTNAAAAIRPAGGQHLPADATSTDAVTRISTHAVRSEWSTVPGANASAAATTQQRSNAAKHAVFWSAATGHRYESVAAVECALATTTRSDASESAESTHTTPRYDVSICAAATGATVTTTPSSASLQSAAVAVFDGRLQCGHVGFGNIGASRAR